MHPCRSPQVSWQEPVLALFEDFTARVPGTEIERKSVNMTWHFRRAADRQFARWLQKDLVMLLGLRAPPFTKKSIFDGILN